MRETHTENSQHSFHFQLLLLLFDPGIYYVPHTFPFSGIPKFGLVGVGLGFLLHKKQVNSICWLHSPFKHSFVHDISLFKFSNNQ